MDVLGVDIGGSGIKAAPVDVTTGTLTAERVKVPTPRPARPEPIAEAVKQLVADFGWSGPIGLTFPGVMTGGVTRTAANLDPAWIGLDARALLSKAAGRGVGTLTRSAVRVPVVTSTGAALIPEPPMSPPSTST